jgi:hypothetical protein
MNSWDDFNPELFYGPPETYDPAEKRDSAVKLQAMKYLAAREKTASAIWNNGGSGLGNFLPRIAEVWRARGLARELGYEFIDQDQLDLFLPTIAENMLRHYSEDQ